MSEPLFKTDCPGCGAPVHAHSATAVTLVCGYCNSMLVRQDGSIADTGRDSALLEDFSPLQIGTSGRFGMHGFMLAGRLQVRYGAGVWNEWYALFDDGTAGWLSEAGDRYVFTRAVDDLPADLPAFEDTRAGFSGFVYQNRKFLAADVRSITMSRAAAQGELPFLLEDGRTGRVSDWRWEDVFLTLDYAGGAPEGYLGRGVTLDELQLVRTRTDEQIKERAGVLKGTRRSENCPNCGSPVQWIAGLAGSVICSSCGSDLDTSGGKAELIQANNMRMAQEQALRLPLGSKGKINRQTYTVIGAVRKEELDAQDTFDALYGKPPVGMVPEGWWIEYLLYHPTAGFLWLVEASDGSWSLSETLDKWPRLDANGQPQGLEKLYDYGGRVSYAVGAFYWRVKSGDLNYYSDYRQGGGKLSAEYSAGELAWSKSSGIGFNQVAEWFGLKADKPQYTAEMAGEGVSKSLMALVVSVLLIVNLPACFMGGQMWLSLLLLGIGVFVLLKNGDRDKPDFLIIAAITVAMISVLHYLIVTEPGTGGSYIGTGRGGFSGGHK